jgi:plastocyanin
MRSIRPLAPALLLLGAAAVAACSGGSGASPSTDPSSAPSAASSAAPSAAGSAASPDASAATRIDVVGTDYAFSDFGTELSGPTTFAFRNEGTDLHEMVIVRKNDGVTTTFEELLALPEEEAFAQVQFLGQTMAEAGQTAPDVITAEQPGEYLMICFIPQGMTSLPSLDPNASGPPDLGDGPPHFTLGMLKEFTIAQ